MSSHEQETKFIVLSSKRSGSTWLISLLNALEGTTAYGELFLGRKRDPERSSWDLNLSYLRFIEAEPYSKIRPISVFAYLNNLYRQSGAVGFKLMYSQMRKYPEIAVYLFLHSIHVVHLIRRNYLDGLISEAIMQKTDQAHITSTQSVPKDIQIELDAKNLIDRLNQKHKTVMNIRAMLRWCGLPCLEVAYEDLRTDPSTFIQISDFLSIPSEWNVSQSVLVKINRKSQSEVIRNYEEVKNTLRGTPFAHLIV